MLEEKLLSIMSKATVTFFLVLTFSSISARSFGNQQLLRELSARYSRQWTSDRAEAELRAEKLGLPIKGQIGDDYYELQGFDDFGKPMYNITHNFNAAQTISTNKTWPGGATGLNLTGAGETLAIWDQAEARSTHQEFGGRATQQDDPDGLSSHATHVAGTMMAAGVNNSAKGMSFQAFIDCYDWNDDSAEMAFAASEGLMVSNHSYGRITGWRWNYLDDNRWAWFGNIDVSETEDYYFGFYDELAHEWDTISYYAPHYLIVKSAGNNRNYGPSNQPVEHNVREYNEDEQEWEWVLSSTVRQVDGGSDGYDCIGHRGIAKNIMTVGAVNDITNGYSQPSDVVMSSFSSWGPTDDGRVKPDIVANGVSLYSSDSNNNSHYSSKSGTSMSAPNVSGSIGLLQRFFKDTFAGQNPLSSTIKALIIHTADAAGVSAGPDYIFGWGLMNTASAATLIADHAVNNNHIFELVLNDGQQMEFQIEYVRDDSAPEPLKVTIAWTDPPADVPEPALNSPQLMLINDLDMRVVTPDNIEMEPWTLNLNNPAQTASTGDNFRDNVEKIEFVPDVSGVYHLVISHKFNLTNEEQPFSLIVTGNQSLTTPAPDDVNIVIDGDHVVISWLKQDLVDGYRVEGSTDFSGEFSDFSDAGYFWEDDTHIYWSMEIFTPMKFYRVKSFLDGY
jgi:trimeric autotransporter adhesin